MPRTDNKTKVSTNPVDRIVSAGSTQKMRDLNELAAKKKAKEAAKAEKTMVDELGKILGKVNTGLEALYGMYGHKKVNKLWYGALEKTFPSAFEQEGEAEENDTSDDGDEVIAPAPKKVKEVDSESEEDEEEADSEDGEGEDQEFDVKKAWEESPGPKKAKRMAEENLSTPGGRKRPRTSGSARKPTSTSATKNKNRASGDEYNDGDDGGDDISVPNDNTIITPSKPPSGRSRVRRSASKPANQSKTRKPTKD